jgi:hypothetical protein
MNALSAQEYTRPGKRARATKNNQYSFRAVQPVAFERTLHVLDSVDDVMVNHLLVLDTDTTTAVACAAVQ